MTDQVAERPAARPLLQAGSPEPRVEAQTTAERFTAVVENREIDRNAGVQHPADFNIESSQIAYDYSSIR